MAGSEGTDEPGSALARAGEALVGKLMNTGSDGSGLFPGTRHDFRAAAPDPESAEREIQRLLVVYRRYVAAGGFASGLGGFTVMAVTLPADTLYFLRAGHELTTRIAHLRGYDVESEYVRSVILLSMLGAEGTAMLSRVGADAGTRAATVALQRLPGHVLTRINRMAGYRFVTKFGQKGTINLAKVVPIAGGAVGAGVNVAGINAIAHYAKKNFPRIDYR